MNDNTLRKAHGAAVGLREDPPRRGGLSSSSWKHFAGVIAVLILAAAVRVPHLGQHGYSIDEMWTVEVATGRGSLHQQIPLNQLTAAPELFRLSDAPPWWNIWTHMELTHPPLYWILLRWWEDLFGDSDTAGRAFSVFASLVAVLVFYDVVRLLNGPTVAFWAVVLIALASPQVDYGRTTRNYAMLTAVALMIADALVRIEKLGLTSRRWVALCLATLATLLTHYFAIGTIIGLMVYSAVRFSGPLRIRILCSFLAAGLIFAGIWGPFMWRQSRMFSTTDEATQFLTFDQPHHLEKTLERVLLAPASLLFPPRLPSRFVAMGAAVLYVLPLAMFRRRPELLMWGCWLIGTVAVVAGLDVFRGTAHLFYSRYTLLAGPAVYALLPALFANMKPARWLGHLIPAAAAIGCALAIPDVYEAWMSDPPEIVHDFAHLLQPTDLLVFAGSPQDRLSPELQFMLIDRYMGPIPCPIAVLTAPANAEVVARVEKSDAAYLFAVDANCCSIVPGTHPFAGRMYLGRGLRWRLK